MEDATSLKNKTITGLIWSFTELAANHFIQFIIQVILARLLLPEHFGIIGMTLIFVAISNTIIDSGFSQALIRDQETSQADYSTIFYINFILSILMYLIIFISSSKISIFFAEPELMKIIRVTSLILIINALGIIQRVILIKKVNFKTITKISVIASIISGTLTIALAILGYGVWSLITNLIAVQFINTLLLWFFNKWKPSLVFSVKSFKKYLKFSYKLLISGLIDTFYNNLLFLIIGKMYSTTKLGYYTNAVRFKDVASYMVSISVERVSYPILSSIQEDKERLKSGFKKVVRTSVFINFPIMVGLMAISNPLFSLVLGEKWMPSVIYFQLLCVAGMLYPLHTINQNILQVKGRSDLFLLIEIIKKTVLTILIIVSLWLKAGIIGLIIAIVISSYIDLFINTYFSAKEINYSAKEQLKDILPVYFISMMMGLIVFLLGEYISGGNLFKLTFQISTGVAIYILACRVAKVPELGIVYEILQSILIKVKLSLRKKDHLDNTQ